MKFLNANKVLCLSAHPDDAEYGALGSIIKFNQTLSATHKNERLTEKFKVEFVPTVVIIDNKKIIKLEGSKKIEEFYGNVINPNPDSTRNL